jgi:formate dehydrogenase subunit gamma
MSRLIRSVLAAALTLVAMAVTAAPDAAPAAGAPQVSSVNIQDVKPDASDAPGYAQQTNQQRAVVQPGNNAPMWRDVGRGTEGYSSLPKSQAPEAGVLIQPFVQYPGSRLTNAGEAWRQVRNQWIIPYGGSFLLVVLGAIAIFYWRKGAIRMHGKPTGVVIERFTPLERSAHWANAIAFVVLAVSGVTMAFGKFFIQPFIGDMLFGWLTYGLKTAHNFAGPLFAVSLLMVFITFVKDNLPKQWDVNWLLKGGGMFGGEEIPSHRFNAGEKVLFWVGVFALGLLVVASGLVLDKVLPYLVYERASMQIAHMIHAVAAVLMLGMFMGHIYMGTIGTEGAYQAMKTGYVDETWAKEHHELWYNDIKANKIPAHRSSPQAGKAANA